MQSTPETSQHSRVILKNTTFITVGSFILRGVNLLFSILIVRRLGDDRFGQYSTVLAFVGLFQIFAELGISQYVMREIARDITKTQRYFWNLVVLRLILAFVGIIGITLGAVAMGYPRELVIGVLIMTTSYLLSAFEAPLESVLSAHARFDYISLITIIGRVTFILFGGAFLLLGWSYIWLIFASLLSLIPQIIFAFAAARKNNYLDLNIVVTPPTWGTLIRNGLPFGLISLTLSITFGIDTVMLSRFQPDEVVGWYRAAYNLVFSMLVISDSFKTAIVPTLSKTYAENPAEVQFWFYRIVRVFLAITVPISVGGMLLSFPMVHFFLGVEYMPAAVALQILIWDIPFLTFQGVCGNITTIVNLEKKAALVYTLTSIANVAMNLYAIPRYGMIGASLVTVLTDFVAVALFYLILKESLKLPGILTAFAKVTLAVLIMAGVVYYLRDLSWVIALVTGAFVYITFLFLLRLPDETERQIITKILAGIKKRLLQLKGV
jgi:O-antigen/teichoic acid export membrane protein